MHVEATPGSAAAAPVPPRVVFVAEDITAISGGAPAVVRQLSQRVAEAGAHVELVHVVGQDHDVPPGVQGLGFRAIGPSRAWAWGRGLRRGMRALSHSTQPSRPVFHLHGIWSAAQYFAAREAHAAQAPFVLTAHGMLEPWLWNQQGWKVAFKKRAYWRAMAYPALRRAAVVHAITPLERDHLRALFPHNRIDVIPNAIEVPPATGRCESRPGSTILFLGRLEPKKGVDILIRAFADAGLESDWKLVIAGPAWSEAYLADLRRLVARLGLGERVDFPGAVFGKRKQDLLETAWALAAPSHSEVVGLVNLEAAVSYLPSITTPQTGLHDWEEGGGRLVQPNAEAVAQALRFVCSWSAAERASNGISSRRLVEQRYSWQAVLPMWLKLYNSLHR